MTQETFDCWGPAIAAMALFQGGAGNVLQCPFPNFSKSGIIVAMIQFDLEAAKAAYQEEAPRPAGREVHIRA